MVGFGDFGKTTSPAAAKANPNDRSDANFAMLVPSGDSKAQRPLPPSGPYHVNHFICYFKVAGRTFTDAEGAKTAGLLTYHFLRYFCFIFSETNIARAQYGPRGLDVFDGSRTVEFTIGSNAGTVEHRAMGFIHPDWVAMSSVPPVSIQDIDDVKRTPLTSFYGNTLKRKWDTAIEKKILPALAGAAATLELNLLAPALLLLYPFSLAFEYLSYTLSYEGVRALLGINRQHFLAGTRSWRIGYDSQRKAFFIETIAIERFSCAFYEWMEGHHSTRNDILALWDNLLNNFVKTKILRGYRFEPAPPPDTYGAKQGYEHSKILPDIRHGAWQYAGLVPLTREFYSASPTPAIQAMKMHAGVLAHLPKPK